MDMSKYNVVSDSNDLKAGGDNEGKTYRLTIRDTGEVTFPPGKFNNEPVTKSTLFFDETDKRMVLNPTNNRHLCEKYTDDGDNWKGKTISAESEKWKSDAGEGWMWTVRALEVEFSDEIPF